MNPTDNPPPRHLVVAIALVSASLLILEIVLSRIFSVLFFYHYSFFAVGLVMSGLTMGGLWAGRWKVASLSDDECARRLSLLAGSCALAQLAGLGLLIAIMPPTDDPASPRMAFVIMGAFVFLPSLSLAGTFLAVILARRRAWVGRLYAADLAGAALGCVAAVAAMRLLAGPVCIVFSAMLAGLVPIILKRGQQTRSLLRLAPLATVLAVLAGHQATGGSLIHLRSNNEPYLERWNEHSRLWVTHSGQDFFEILIDRAAGTFTPILTPRKPSEPLHAHAGWLNLVSSFPYRMERHIGESAIIGVGGGRDLLPPLASGARHVDGFEINRGMVRLLTHDLKEFNNIADWPEVSLMHREGRIGLRHSEKAYDTIQASQIDTWAATAAGGFVLSENGLYTKEAWRLFLSRLTDRGWLSMTRWYLPDAPAETHRLVALAVESLRESGINDPRGHIALAVHASKDQILTSARGNGFLATIIVSRPLFTPAELARYEKVCAESAWTMIIPSSDGLADPVIEGLLDRARYQDTVRAHPFDITPPTDDRPYFFLLLRPGQFLSVPDTNAPALIENTMNAVRVMMGLLILSIAFAAAVLLTANRWFPRDELAPGARSNYRWLTLYFLGIGAGYMFVQLAFHQRLILALGQPAYSLSVILFSMLLGGGIGSALSGLLRPPAVRIAAMVFIPLFLVFVWTISPAFSRLENLPSEIARVSICAGIVGLTGVILGIAFPIGATAAAGLGDWAVQRMWAVNGAASILGSSAAALMGMILGGRAMFVAGIIFYLMTAFAAWRVLRPDDPARPPD